MMMMTTTTTKKKYRKRRRYQKRRRCRKRSRRTTTTKMKQLQEGKGEHEVLKLKDNGSIDLVSKKKPIAHLHFPHCRSLSLCLHIF